MDSELEFHFQAWKLIDGYRRRGVVALHIPNGEKRSPRTAARLKAMGVVPGASDFLVIVNGHNHFIELKAAKGRLSPNQKAFLSDVEAAGCTTHVVRSMEELCRVLDDIGALFIRVSKSVHGGHGAQPVTEGAEALG